VLGLLDAGDGGTARAEIDAVLGAGSHEPGERRLLQGIGSLLDGDAAGAVRAIGNGLDRDRGDALAYNCLARAQAAAGRAQESLASLDRAQDLDPALAETWFFRSALAFEGGDYNTAMRSLLRAIECNLDNGGYWQRLNQWLIALQPDGPMLVERALLAQALAREKIEFAAIDQVVYSSLKATPSFQSLLRLAADGTLHRQLCSGQALALLEDDLLLWVLRRTTLYVAEYEQALTALRRTLLDAIAADALPSGQRRFAIRLTAALAVYALNTDFVFFISEPEAAQLQVCRERLSAAPAAGETWLLLTAISACYGLLADDPPPVDLDALAGAAAGLAEFGEMLDLHVVEPRRLAQLRSAVPRLGPISNEVSLAVQAQYEEHPYPRWRFLGAPQALTAVNRIGRYLPHLRPDQRPRLQESGRDTLDILIAGCGTGRNALLCAREYPGAQMLAVDLSATSLAYAMMKAADFEMHNIEFLQGDVLDLPALGREFDLIESIGVLHHMAQPAAGLAALARCLRPGGWMRIALYSYLARQAVRAARERIVERGCMPTSDGIRRFRHELLSNATDPLGKLCTRWRDFFSLAECRDLLFHVQEHQFTAFGLEQLLAPTGLEFMGFEGAAGLAGRSEPRITDWQSLQQWGVFEEANPDFFGGMYVMWLRRPC
jgi:ubiquinone/menaquinone biosynthesis C-methylase UbiE